MSDRRLYELHASICQTLSNPKRLEVIDCLRDGELPVSKIVETTNISQANLSQHLGLMREKGIVIARREGVNVYYRLSNPKITQACDLMRQVLLEYLEAAGELAETSRTR
ncbi:MAG TPA: metalloregulator ArsR/SmtB family transcription factor [Anaerolineales bacterium]|nr:metalloregulator ArsR/SmtB family transcription factor [Anaerolineales bacterium]